MNVNTPENLFAVEEHCPFFATSSLTSTPSCATSRRASSRLCYCETEDYDNCPQFLGRLTRNSQPKFRGVPDLALK